MKTENMDLNIRTKTQSDTNIKSKLNHFLLETLHIFSNNNHYVILLWFCQGALYIICYTVRNIHIAIEHIWYFILYMTSK